MCICIRMYYVHSCVFEYLIDRHTKKEHPRDYCECMRTYVCAFVCGVVSYYTIGYYIIDP